MFCLSNTYEFCSNVIKTVLFAFNNEMNRCVKKEVSMFYTEKSVLVTRPSVTISNLAAGAGQGHATNYTPTASNLLLSSDAEYDHNNNYRTVVRKNLQLAVTSKISFPNGSVHIKWLYYSIPSPRWQGSGSRLDNL